MGRPKKDKYIRDLFEDNFSKKFVYYVCNIEKDELMENYLDSRLKLRQELKDGKAFIEAIPQYYTVIEDKELYSITTFNKCLYDFNFRAYFYQIVDFKNRYAKIINKYEFRQEIFGEINKIFNKSIAIYIEKNPQEFILCVPSRNCITITIIDKILDSINNCALRKLTPRYKKERTASTSKKNCELLAYEYKRMMNFIDVFHQIQDELKDTPESIGNFSDEYWLRYSTALYLDLYPNDAEIDFLISHKNDTITDKELAFLYLRNKYNYEKNDEALDKSIDRGHKRYTERDSEKIYYKKLDSYLEFANLYCSGYEYNLEERMKARDSFISLFDSFYDTNKSKKIDLIVLYELISKK